MGTNVQTVWDNSKDQLFATKKLHVKYQCKLKYWIFTLELLQTFVFSFWNIVVRKFLTMLHEFFSSEDALRVFSSTWFLSWLNVFKPDFHFQACFQTWFYSPRYSYKSCVLFQSSVHLLTLKLKMYFKLNKPVLMYTLLQTFCCSCWTLLRKSEETNHQMQHALFIWSIQINSRLRSTNCSHS